MKEFHYALGFYSPGKNRKNSWTILIFFNTIFNNTKSTPTLKSNTGDESSLQGEVWTKEGLIYTFKYMIKEAFFMWGGYF